MALEIFKLPSAEALEQPVLRAGLTQIQGGFILLLSFHHRNGAAAISRIWCSYCENEAKSEVFDADLISRNRLMPVPNSAGIEEFPILSYEAEKVEQIQTNSYFMHVFGPVRRWLKL